MKKLFLLIPAFLLSLAVNAATTAVSSGVNKLTTAITAASAGDILELGNGYFYEDGDFDMTKNLTIKAADGAHPIIANLYYFKVVGGADITFQGIKFDGAAWRDGDAEPVGAYSHCVRSHDNSTGEEDIQFIDCEFTNYPNFVIYTQRDTRRWNSITIRNCTFYNNKSCAVRIDESGGNHTKQSCNSLTIENSTFYNVIEANDVIYYNAPDAEHTTSLTMDHCTFYNHQKRAVYWQKSTNLTITNCIFAQPSTVSDKSVECVGGNITKCLSYKTGGYSSAATPTGNLTSNPYFVNTTPGSYDFSVASFSPAHNAGTDNKDLGDYLRWNSDDAAHPTTINISAGTDAIKAAVEAAWPDDEIVLAEGTYNESASIELDKNLTIKAADGASPIVVPVKDFAISNGVEVTIQGIKFDGSSITGNLICSGDATAGNQLTLDGCEFYGYTPNNSLIRIGSAKKLDACTINDCYFHNINKSCFFNESTAASNLTITNSTFANITTAAGAPFIGVIDTRATAGSFLVDHCTFYNVNAMSTDYAAIGKVSTSGAVVSNCIFAMPSAVDGVRAIRDVSAANNCLTFNYIKDSNKGIHNDVTKTNCIFADPLFTNATGGDFTFPGDYANDNVSPARNAGTDGSDLGDPRWYTPATYPETDFASGYAFTAAKAKLNGNITLETNESAPTHPYIRYIHINATTGTAEWIIKATKACYVQATVNMADNEWTTDPSDANMFKNYKHIFVVEVRNANNVLVGSVQEGPYTNGNEDGYETYPTVNLPGTIHIPAEGVYTVKLLNPRKETRCGVANVTLAYAGGDVQTITNTADFETNINDAYFSANGSRADGKISFSGNAVASEWLRWNVTVANSDYYDITLNSDVASGHIYSVTFYDGETQVARVAESAWHNTTGALDLGRRFLPAGDYVMEIKNSVSSNSDAKIVSVQAVAFVAPIIALPNTLPAENAITSELAYEDGGALYFTPSDKRGYILDQWAKWKVSVSTPGLYLFTMNVSSTNEQSYKITILDSENNELEVYAKNPGSGAKTIKHYFELEAGNYFVMVQNTTNNSYGHMMSMVVTEPAGVVTIDESATDNTAWADKVVDKNAEGPLYDVQIQRSFRGGMNNTFCLPFAVSSSQCKEVFGNDVEIYTLGEATIEDYILNLTVNPASDIYPGTPVLIKPARDIVNPVFTDVKFTAATASATTKTNADFVGSFVKTPLTASDNLLYVGPENKVFFLSVDYDMPGMRAWFVIHDVPAALGSPKALRSARIIEKEQITTSILNVETSDDTIRKVLHNGQIVIIRGNEMYNMQGQHIQ